MTKTNPSQQIKTDARSFNLLEHGFTFVDSLFSKAECNSVINALDLLKQQPLEQVDKEEDGSIRSIYCLHKNMPTFSKMCSDHRILDTIQASNNKEYYIHQSAINLKPAKYGGCWGWHQDYLHWHHIDGMPNPECIIAAIFLDDVTHDNGAINLMPKSHLSLIDAYYDFPEKSILTASESELLIKRYGISTPIGKRGSVLFFNANIIHSSGLNQSTHDRRIAIVAYNPIDNKCTKQSRAVWRCERDATPITKF